MTRENTIRSIAQPYAVAATATNLFVLNENSTALALVDTNSMTVTSGFLAGDAPGPAAQLDGKLFVPQAGNLAVEDAPTAPTAAQPIADNLILTNTAVPLGGKIYANESSTVRVVDPAAEKATSSIIVNTGGGAVYNIAGSGDGVSLLATYQVIGIGFVHVDSGLVKVNTSTSTQQILSSFPFAPGFVASSPDGTRAYAAGYNSGNEVGTWDTRNNAFLNVTTIPGNPFYVALAVSVDGSTLYLANMKGTVDFVDASTMQLIASLAVGARPSGISLSADGRQALVTDSTLTSVTVLNLLNRSIMGTVAVGAPSSGSAFLN